MIKGIGQLPIPEFNKSYKAPVHDKILRIHTCTFCKNIYISIQT